MAATTQTISAFPLRFLEPPTESTPSDDGWLWKPRDKNGLQINTATFCGKNQADDYTRE